MVFVVEVVDTKPQNKRLLFAFIITDLSQCLKFFCKTSLTYFIKNNRFVVRNLDLAIILQENALPIF